MTLQREPRYRGIFPVVPTTFTESGELDLASQKRCVDFMIDAGSHGLCILANFSEQFLIADDERERRRAEMAGNAEWLAYLAKAMPYIQKMENRILTPLPFSPIK